MSDIPERQNDPHLLQYLAAQRQLYSEDKRYTGIWFTVSVIIAVLGTGVLAVAPAVNALFIFFWVLIALGELLVLPLLTQRRSHAACIQELFDTELLQLEWNKALGKKPEARIIKRAVDKFNKRKNPEEEWQRLHDWYESKELATVPLHQARILCQKENITWDAEQRREWAKWLVGGTVVFVILLIAAGIVARWQLWQLFTGSVLLVIPLIIAVISHASRHLRAAKRLNYLEGIVEELWEDAQKADADIAEITRRTRNLQDEIFHHRQDNVPVYDWFYKKLGKKPAPVTLG